MFKRLSTTATWRDLHAGSAIIERLKDITKALPTDKGSIALFSGPAGTGKTLASQIIAAQLGLNLYRVDLTAVINKYIGETEKHLNQVFEQAEKNKAVLLFDEADALFGKRTDVKDAHDRYANQEVSHLLNRIEQHDGLVILTSNLREDIDDAFLRQIRWTVDFPAPRPTKRLSIWRRLLRWLGLRS